MTHASDNFFPQNSGKEKREPGKESMTSLTDKANSQLQKISIKDMELKKIAQSPSVQSRQGSSNGEIPEPTKSQEAEFDKEIKEQIGARSNSVVEYADPPDLLPEGQERPSVNEMHKGDSDSDDENSGFEKKEETVRLNQENLKRQSLASSLGQYGQAAVQDMRSIFKPSSKRKVPPQVRLPSIPNKQMTKNQSARSLSPAVAKHHQAKQALAEG